MYSLTGSTSSTYWVSPFGYQRITSCLRLPVAFRSRPRPSSSLGALATTLCSCSLDYVDPETRYSSSGQLTFKLQLVFQDFLSRLLFVQLSRCADDLSSFRMLFRILKTIQMIERQLFLRTLRLFAYALSRLFSLVSFTL